VPARQPLRGLHCFRDLVSQVFQHVSIHPDEDRGTVCCNEMESESPKRVEIDVWRLLGFVHKNRRVEVWHLHSTADLPRRQESPAHSGQRPERSAVPRESNHEPPRDPSSTLFADGAQFVAARKQPKPPKPPRPRLQAKLETARTRPGELVIFGMKTWLPRRLRKPV
jgi:hypothetical protein